MSDERLCDTARQDRCKPLKKSVHNVVTKRKKTLYPSQTDREKPYHQLIETHQFFYTKKLYDNINLCDCCFTIVVVVAIDDNQKKRKISNNDLIFRASSVVWFTTCIGTWIN